MGLYVAPCILREAWLFVRLHHRHNAPARGGKFALCAVDDGGVVHGVAVVSRPIARRNQDGWTAEVVRVASDGTPNVNSLLYAACWKACKAMGYRRLLTYTLPVEGGASLRAAGWVMVDDAVRDGPWTRTGRAVQTVPLLGRKWRWEAASSRPPAPAPRFNLVRPTVRPRRAALSG